MTIFSQAQAHFINQLSNAPVQDHPFQHIHSGEIFPGSFYAEILNHMPDLEAYQAITETSRVKKDDQAAKSRKIIPLTRKSVENFEPGIKDFWKGFVEILGSAEFLRVFFGKFMPSLEKRFGEQLATIQILVDILLIRDLSNYSLGPHTDHPSRIATFILYLPANDGHPHLGTSFYVPKEQGRTCVGGPHYKHDQFDRIFTMDYRPNTALGFLKTSNSFHGVEPVKGKGIERNLIHIAFRHIG